jgi:hypothetical protein
MVNQKGSKTNPKKSPARIDPTPKKPQARVELRCIDCDCTEDETIGKLLGVLLNVDNVGLKFLRSIGARLELPCQTKKSKRRLVAF